MSSITVELVSVDRLVWKGEATMVTAETTEGEIGVLPGHEPMLGQLIENGVVTITPTEGDRRVAAVQGGFLSVSAEKVTVLADWAIWASEVDESLATTNVASEDELTKSRGNAALRALRRKKMSL